MDRQHQRTGRDDMVVQARGCEPIVRRRQIAACLWSGALTLAAVVVAARLSGVVASGLHPLIVLFASLFSWSSVATAWWLHWKSSEQRPFSAMLLSGMGSTMFPLLTGGALLSSGNGIGYWTLLFATLMGSLASAVWSGLTAEDSIRRATSSEESVGTRQDVDVPASPLVVETPDEPQSVVTFARSVTASHGDAGDFGTTPSLSEEVETGFFEDSSIEQQSTRRVTAQGVAVEVLSRVHFVAGQRQQSLHLPLTPAFAESPEVEVECLGEEEVEVTVATVYAYGIRVDVRRESCHSAADALIGITLTGRVAMEKVA